jgi:hypothetical protein
MPQRPDFEHTLADLGLRRVDDAPLMLLGGPAMPGDRARLYALASRGFG